MRNREIYCGKKRRPSEGPMQEERVKECVTQQPSLSLSLSFPVSQHSDRSGTDKHMPMHNPSLIRTVETANHSPSPTPISPRVGEAINTLTLSVRQLSRQTVV
mmetsp:Transcript_37673/g.74073  ORF Transcript_37673/g.74073 Transcript_37673/m.74073 type:complete len:103 (+) Transcript_37673:1696-2004(+)